MSVEQKVLRKVTSVLDLKKLKKSLPREPHVVLIIPEEYVNFEGEDALKVTIVLSNDTTDEQLAGDNVFRLNSVIRHAVQDAGIALFPYTFFATEAELEELELEDEE